MGSIAQQVLLLTDSPMFNLPIAKGLEERVGYFGQPQGLPLLYDQG